MNRDYIPTSWAAYADWLLNFVTQLKKLAAKYGVSTATIDALEADSDWAQYYVPAKLTAAQQEKQLTDYMAATRGGVKDGKGTPTKPVWELPAGAPPDVAPDIDGRIREVANFIKNQKSVYTLADGELLGIVSVDESSKPDNQYAPTLKINQMTTYHIGFEFRKEGLDAARFEYRKKGGAWTALGDSAKSPTDFMIPPTTPGEAEQIEIRAIFLKDYKPFGSYSPIYTATIQP